MLFSDTQKVADLVFANLERSTRKDPKSVDFLGAVAGVLKEVFKAVKEYKELISSAFGLSYVERFVVEVIKDLDTKVHYCSAISSCRVTFLFLLPHPVGPQFGIRFVAMAA